MDKPLTKLLEEQLSTKVEGFEATKAYLKNNVALRRTLNYMVRNLYYEYSNTSIQYQVPMTAQPSPAVRSLLLCTINNKAY